MECYHYFIICSTESQFSFWDTRFITAIGILIGFSTFIGERLIARNDKLKRIRESWFLTIIVQPNLEDIDKFYAEVINNMKISIITLKENIMIRHYDYIELESNEIVKFTEIRREFINNFVSLVKGHSTSLSQNLNQIINNLNDLYSVTLDVIDHNPLIDSKDIENNILENKSLFIEELFKSLKKG